MKWHKLGLIYNASHHAPWAKTHAMLPTPDVLPNGLLRVYLTFCDKFAVGRTGYVELDPDDSFRMIHVSPEPILDVGKPGTFDENGVVQTSIVNLPDGRKYMYYAGFELGTKIRYRILTGLAVSEDGGASFHRIKQTPILERSDHELYFRCGAHVLFENNIFKLWYVAGSEWINVDDKSLPVYIIKYLESSDGIHWEDQGKICINVANDDEYGFGRPYVYRDTDIYKMIYSIRTQSRGYQLGYAESSDGINWLRKDNELKLPHSANDFDSTSMCYAAIYRRHPHTYLFYNGNDFGRTGLGYARLET